MDFDLKTAMLHRPPMLLVDSLEEAGADFAAAKFKITEDNIFLEGGVFAREALAEVCAQTLAAFNAYNSAKAGKETGKGFLVGLRNFNFYKDAAAGDELSCRIKITDYLSQTFISQAEIYAGSEKLAEGELRIFTF
ncbi:3-hydroxymyristoyl/3-hydroxydecanoyl-(acyl carrier protein) dehydratase [Parelusimicrobium proximum]|uniref:hypothetical protein n=1 Tax=Parelusimicrobium proximum TaxID=3228953 RepID=UPI003D16EA0A